MTIIQGYDDFIQLHDGENSRVYRARRCQDGRSTILKILKAEYPTPEQLRRYRQEYHLTHQLRLPHIIRSDVLIEWQRTLVIVFEDFGGIALTHWLSNYPQGLPIDLFLPLSLQIAEALEQLHSQSIIHKDINPANIVLHPETRLVKLIDLGISTQLSRETPVLQSPGALEGTLPYLSPEQTGRMNRVLDYRTDFYSLGVTFYELLTGNLPCDSDDPMEVVHCHIAQPIVLAAAEGNLPTGLVAIVNKLTAKNAEDRYQSAWGLKADLEHCWSQWQTTGTIAEFPLGRWDISDQFRIPQTLYGRERELAALLRAFERVTERQSRPEDMELAPHQAEIILVTGDSGIGKSALVRSLYKPITGRRGYFIAGKFNQFQQNSPYSALVDVFADLVKQLLGEPEALLQRWCHRLREVLGPNGQLVIEVIPDMELLLGPQPPVPELGASEAQNRFNLVFQQFIQAFCCPEHPLVMFLDDVQWADLATLNLLERLLSNQPIADFLLIMAYRDHEVSAGHPLALTIAQLQRQAVQVQQLSLEPLELEQIEALMAETLHQDIRAVKSLAELVIQKTQGSPFFVNQFLKTLHNEELLTFNYELCQWCWDLEQIKCMGFTDNVVELMVMQLQKLPQPVQEVLSVAAYLGTEFELDLLSRICNQDPVMIFAHLQLPIEQGLIIPRSPLDEQLLIQNYQFGHDRIQQAAYELVPSDERATTHLKIGRILFQQSVQVGLEELLFDIVDHLNQGIAWITDLAEVNRLAQLNLQAGQKAMKAVAHKAALAYLEQGIALLGEETWQHHYDLTLSLHNEGVKAAFLSADLQTLDRLTAAVMQRTTTALDRVTVSAIKIEAYGIYGRLTEAVATGIEMLAQLGIVFPEQPTSATILRAFEQIEQLTTAIGVDRLLSLPEMTDPHILAALSLLVKVEPVAFISSSPFHPLINLKKTELSLLHGNALLSTVAYATYAMILCGLMDQIERGYQFGHVAIALLSQFDRQEFAATVLMLVHSFISHWKTHLSETLEPLRQAHRIGVMQGDFAYAGYAGFDYCTHAYLIGQPLPEVESEIQYYREALRQMGQYSALSYLQGYHQAVTNLIHVCSAPYELRGHILNEDEIIPHLRSQNNQAGLWHLYTAKLPLCYLFEAFALGYEVSQFARQSINSGMAGVAIPVLNFYESLCCLALLSDPQVERPDQLWYQVVENQRQLERWGQSAPMNYQHKFDLVEAERYRVLGEKLAAIEAYDRAIAGAISHQYLQEAALANELAAKFYLAWGKANIAQVYWQEAHYGYLCWGATAKVRHLETTYPQFFQPESAPGVVRKATRTSANRNSTTLDLSTVMKASQAIASQILLDNLLQTLMKILLENAGAQIGCLLFPTDSLEIFEIAIYYRADAIVLTAAHPLEQLLPVTILHYVARTQDSVVLDDATQSSYFAQDPYFNSIPALSVLCYPLLNQGNLVGLIYLENRVTLGAFTRHRLEFLQLLSGQAAIALTNAQLYAEKVEYTHTLEQKVAERTAELQQANLELSNLVNLDGLTQVANRRCFDDRLQQEWKQLGREKTPLSLILFDVDYFKRYNDFYGHQAGDACLVQVAQAVKEILHRPADLVARYGGEEFAVILPNTELAGGLAMAERIRTAVRSRGIAHERSEVSDYVSISLGIARLIPTPEICPNTLIAQADQALYQAKQQGRNRVIAYSADETLG
ncbi:MAG: diguanylate cyclase [Leptolyngbyaceae cyanobacterium bins.59]|nr:diguanylate cyclase [Leptolyngbyaceae cyanobacterium bins.59]